MHGTKQKWCHVRSRIRSRIEGLSPLAALLLLSVPTITVELLKIAAIFFVGDGHWETGLIVMICAYAVSLFLTERLFEIVRPKLMSYRWFRYVWSVVVSSRQKTLRYVRAKWAACRF